MRLWTVEHGTLWVVEAGAALPPPVIARLDVSFAEARSADVDELAVAMSLPDTTEVHRRLATGRRCFVLRSANAIVCYGWVTQGPEDVGELERRFHFLPDEAYIWDCGTVAQLRGRRCYSALLSAIVRQLSGEGVTRVWIGASRLNRPSVRGMATAGFHPVVDATYRRVLSLASLWIRRDPSADAVLALAAERILIGSSERRFGPLVLGLQPQL